MEDVVKGLNKWIIAQLDVPVSLGQPVDYGSENAYAKVHWQNWVHDPSSTQTIDEITAHIEFYSRESNIYALNNRVFDFVDAIRHKLLLEDGSVVTLVGNPNVNFLELEGARKASVIFTMRKEEA